LKGEVQKSLAAGCTAHLVKPIRKAQLLQAIIHCTENLAPNDAPPVDAKDAKLEEKLVLEVSAELEALMPTFFANRRRDVEKIVNALARGDFDRIRAIGHGVKGAGGTYGSTVISQLGARIEQAAIDQKVEEIDADVRALDDYCFCKAEETEHAGADRRRSGGHPGIVRPGDQVAGASGHGLRGWGERVENLREDTASAGSARLGIGKRRDERPPTLPKDSSRPAR
jgi:HPt (histidine-containing phosphotransfer) domain-containing protein